MTTTHAMLAGAVVGFKADGTRSVLLPAPGESFFSLTTGTVYGRSFTERLFKKMIRPGDRAAFFSSDKDSRGEEGTYLGVHAVMKDEVIFVCRTEDADVCRPLIRPLGAVEKKPELDTETLFREVNEELSQLSVEDIRKRIDESLHRIEKDLEAFKKAGRPPHCPYDRIVFGTADKTKRLVSVEDLVDFVRRMAPLARTIKENLPTDGDVSELINLSFEADELFPEVE